MALYYCDVMTSVWTTEIEKNKTKKQLHLNIFHKKYKYSILDMHNMIVQNQWS